MLWMPWNLQGTVLRGQQGRSSTVVVVVRSENARGIRRGANGGKLGAQSRAS